MITNEQFRQIVLMLPGTTEAPHFERTAFKTKKIFATLHQASKQVNVKLPLAEQDVFTMADKAAIYPVPNKWGLQGWTTIELTKVKKRMLADALRIAYELANAGKTKKGLRK